MTFIILMFMRIKHVKWHVLDISRIASRMHLIERNNNSHVKCLMNLQYGNTHACRCSLTSEDSGLFYGGIISLCVADRICIENTCHI